MTWTLKYNEEDIGFWTDGIIEQIANFDQEDKIPPIMIREFLPWPIRDRYDKDHNLKEEYGLEDWE